MSTQERRENPRRCLLHTIWCTFSRRGYRATSQRFYQRKKTNHSYQERRQSMEDTLSKFMSKSAKRHEENSNLIKEIRASTDAADDINNYGVLGEYYQKARILELKRRYNEDYYSDTQYTVSIKEDTAYPCLHLPKTTKETSSICRIQRRPIRRIRYIACEYS
ncbi:hypothetical protein Tco_1004020 [Tanacetum coccineum]|uniref:Uncharacterized protein n=1 Tax=Tanacetum coccineum TaxID=301880 RepID=A0ABQ5FD13_9ASTR